ncbi:S-layer homology domain-containing protein [Paenibacillus sp. PAMC21692]|uniref:S-layer homology domain-containing protein n=1 Tax=Paenibacillus sp. PAMC21692 TaxID=2762320 RepID=UPI00164D3587|nr:S-layer homology domain-containing protein [Paenibacillus sp. PAMC21692]QNK55921.1 S-layer homology domain-containing protein [Paenibacillus sp. PAMC21692]
MAYLTNNRNVRQLLGVLLVLTLIITWFPLSPVSAAPNESLLEAGYESMGTMEEEWEKLREKLVNIKGIQTSYASAYTSGFTAGQLLGNGEIGVVSEPNVNSHKFYLSHASLWNDRDNHATDRDLDQKITFGGLTLSSSDEKHYSFNIYSPETRVGVDSLYDGDFATKWVSVKPSSTNVHVPKTIYIDFGKEITFDRWAIYHNSYSAGGDLGSAYAIYNNKDYRLERYIAGADGDVTDPENYEVVDSVTGNTGNRTDRPIDPITGQKFRLYISKPHDRLNNQFAAVREIEFYSQGEKVFPFESEIPDFVHEQNIEKAQIESRMNFASAKVGYETWVSDSQNVMVTKLESDAGAPAVAMDATLWAQPSPVKGQAVTGTTVQQTRDFPSTTGTDGDMIYVTRQSTVYPTDTDEQKAYAESRYRSQAAAATRILGATATAVTDEGKATLSFTLQPGTPVYIVTSLIGEGNLGKISELDTLIDNAKELVADKDAEEIDGLYSEHLDWWKNYWLKSYVTLNDADLERYYYGSLYALGSSYRSNHIAPGLYSIWNTSDVGQWGSRYTMNYNFQAPLYGAYAANRIELADTYFDTIMAADIRLKNNAANYGYEGRYGIRSLSARDVARDVPLAEVPKASVKSPQSLPGGQAFTASMAANHFIWMYEYTADLEFLRDEVYPRLSEIGDFWMDYVVLDENPGSSTFGKYQIIYSSANESESGHTDVNTTIDIGFMTYTLTKLIEYSEILNADQDKVEVWQHYLDNLVPIKTATYSGYDTPLIQLAYKIDNPIKGNALINMKDQPISFEGLVAPAELYAIGSDPYMLRMIENTLDYMQAFEAASLSWGNAFAKTYPIAAKIGYPADKLINYFKRPMLNGSSYGSFRATNLTQAGYGGGIESAGSIETINSMLLQTNDGITRVFPNWSPTRDAEFVRLRGKGAFLFTASKDTEDDVNQVYVTSEAGHPLNLVVPWNYDTLGASVYNADTGEAVDATMQVAPYTNEKYVSFNTTIGGNYVLLRGGDVPIDARDELLSLLTEAGDYEEAQYTTETWSVFATALAQAQLIGANANATQEEVNQAIQALHSAMDGLIRKPSGTVQGTGEKLAAGHMTDLTAEGTLDWAHWNNINADRLPVFVNKSTAQSLISNAQIIGSTNDGYRGVGDLATLVQWSDGQPIEAGTNAAGKGMGIYVRPINNGFKFTAAASTQERVLKVYVGTWQADGKLTAQLDDGSEAYVGYSERDADNIAPNKSGKVFTIRYKAAEPGKTLTVTYVVDKNYDSAGNGNVVLQAATLSGPEEPVVLVESVQVTGQDGKTSIGTKGGTLQMIATVVPDDATDQTVTWAVYGEDGSDTDIAVISESGLLTALKDGTAKVAASANDASGVKGEASIVITGQDEVEEADKALLLAAITAAQDKHDAASEGTQKGEYPAGSKALLQNAIDAAQTAADAAAATQEQIDQALAELNEAVRTFESSVITKDPDQGNGSGVIIYPTPAPDDDKDEVEVVIDQGTAIVRMDEDQTSVDIPLQQIAGNPLEVRAGQVTVAVNKQTQALIEQQLDGETGGSIGVQIAPVDTEREIANNHVLKQSLAGQAYDINIVLRTADGRETNLEDIAADGVQVTLPVELANVDKDLLGIYILNEATGQWEYIGGEFNEDQATFIFTQPGTYAVMEYDKTFTDVPAAHWAYRTIKLLSAKHLVAGVSEQEFAPSGKTTRAEFTALLVRVLGLRASNEVTAFEDVNSGDWFAQDVAAAYEAGLVQGVTDSNFAPDQEINREQMAALLVRAFEYKNGSSMVANDALNGYSDSANVSSWASSYVNQAIELGFMQGKSEQVFDPKSDTLRAEAAQAILNFLLSE